MVAKRAGWKTKELRRIVKDCEIEMHRARRAPARCSDARRCECGGGLYMRRVAHCWCLGRVSDEHRHLTCENCGDIGQRERESRAVRVSNFGISVGEACKEYLTPEEALEVSEALDAFDTEKGAVAFNEAFVAERAGMGPGPYSPRDVAMFALRVARRMKRTPS